MENVQIFYDISNLEETELKCKKKNIEDIIGRVCLEHQI